ncbi:MAG: hypothetical protein IVW57_06295 [Ktedonobacterales bacterium]|nr:hypothetical protein [Ktedonobacterales bacterium]
MSVRVVNMVMRAAFALALVLGLIFWTGHVVKPLVPLHMLAGIVLVFSVWYLGFLQARLPRGSFGLASIAGVTGLMVLIIGASQQRQPSGSGHVGVQVVHLLLGVTAVGVGEVCASRLQRAAGASAAERRQTR